MSTYKGIGFDSSTGRTRTGTSSDDISFDSQITATDAVSITAGGLTVTGGTSTDTLTTTGDASIGGDLTVAGDIISRGTVDLVVQDNFIDLNAGNTSATALSSGFTFSLNRNSGFTASTVTTFVAGVASTSNPTFTATDAGSSSLLAAGDVVFITSASEGSNDGLYVVSGVNQASFPQVVTIKGVGTVATNGNTPFAQTQFTADTGNTASAYKVDLKVIAIADGTNFPNGSGSAQSKGSTLEIYVANATESDFTGNGDYSELGAASSLQTAYNTGATITTASSTDIAFTLASGDFSVQNGSMDFGGTTALSTFNVDTSGAVTVDSSGGAVSLQGAAASDFTTSSGALTLDGNGGVSIAGNAAEIDVTTTGALDLNSGAFTLDASTASIDSTDTTNITMTANAASAKTMTVQSTNSNGGGTAVLTMLADDTVNINATGTASTVIGNNGSNNVTIDSAGLVSIDAADASNFTVAGSNLSIGTTTSGELDLTSAGLLDVNAGANLDIDVTGTFDVLSSGAFSVDGTGASNITATSGNLTVSTATSGNLLLASAGETDITAGANLDVNVTGTVDILASSTFSIDGTGASNVSAASGNLTLSTSTSGDVDISSAGDVDIDGANIQADATAGISLDAVTSSNFTISANAASDQTLTIQSTNAGSGDGFLTLNSNGTQIQIGGVSKIDFSSTVATHSGITQLDATSGQGLRFGASANIVDAILDEDTMVSNDVNALATQQSIKAYVDGAGVSNFSKIVTMVAGVAISAGDVIAIKVTGGNEGRAIKADADAIATCNVIGIAIEAQGSVGSNVRVAQTGSMAGFSGLTAGNKLFASTTAGGLTASAPSGSADVVFQVGFAKSASEVIIAPMFIMEIG